MNHMKRPRVDKDTPLHITWRLKIGLLSMRKQQLLKEFEESVRRAKIFGLRVLQFSIQGNHIHLIVEADNNLALAQGLRSLGGRFGKIIRKHAGGRGPVFAGRYHIELIQTPEQMRNTLSYVLLNHSKHKKVVEYVDGYSSAPYFHEWKRLLGKKFSGMIRDQVESLREANGRDITSAALSPPKSWLAREGWRMVPTQWV